MAPLADLTGRIAKLDAELRPIATGRDSGDPLDEARARVEADALVRELVDVYGRGDEHVRRTIRSLLADNPSFTWAATLPWEPSTRDRLRDHLLLFSMKDQERDTRDALLLFGALCAEAGTAGIDVAPVLAAVAALSSSDDRFGWGSTRQLLERAAGTPPGRR